MEHWSLYVHIYFPILEMFFELYWSEYIFDGDKRIIFNIALCVSWDRHCYHGSINGLFSTTLCDLLWWSFLGRHGVTWWWKSDVLKICSTYYKRCTHGDIKLVQKRFVGHSTFKHKNNHRGKVLRNGGNHRGRLSTGNAHCTVMEEYYVFLGLLCIGSM